MIDRVFAPGAAFAAALFLTSGPAVAADPEPLPQCPGDAQKIEPGDMNCTCAPGSGSGSVWGSGPYTADSAICRAAQHAGAIAGEGGDITVRVGPGADSHPGSEQNGISTSSWGSFATSFDVVSYVPPQAELEACTTIPSGVDVHSCTCAANPTLGSIWGNGPYTADSDLCTAAIHDGYIDAEKGGEVHALRAPGLEAYTGEESFNVSSSDWGAFDSSFVFDWNK